MGEGEGRAPVDPALVRAVAVGRTYRPGATDVVALAGATCSVLPRDRVAVVGPSGSGKSTLLHLMAGLDAPTVGAISWPALGRREHLRPTRVALVFQAPSLLAPLSVVENVELPLLLARASAEGARASARACLDRLGLGDLEGRLPEELSGGQAQRVAVARALVVAPRLILADEPTGQLDHPTAERLFDALLAALVGTDTALVVATHDRAIAARMNVAWSMDHGTLEAGTRSC